MLKSLAEQIQRTSNSHLGASFAVKGWPGHIWEYGSFAESIRLNDETWPLHRERCLVLDIHSPVRKVTFQVN